VIFADTSIGGHDQLVLPEEGPLRIGWSERYAVCGPVSKRLKWPKMQAKWPGRRASGATGATQLLGQLTRALMMAQRWTERNNVDSFR
jgi:hypothetical protein